MRILITGIAVFLIWSILSVWLYMHTLRPAMNGQVAEQAIPENTAIEADTIAKADTIARPEIKMPDDMIIYFNFDDASFINDPQTDNNAGKFKSWLDTNQESMLSITGHTDSKGSSEYNQALGLRRAQTMEKYFERMGVRSDKMTTVSQGENQPVADQATEEGRAKNRRAVITIKN
jgi:outer membrane protein OmpA-like peptidoglycan-associated protein